MKTNLGPLALLLPAWAAAAPVEIARESFETSGTQIGYSSNFTLVGSGFTPMSSAVPNDGSRIKGNRVISSGDGARMFAGARINGNVAGDFGPASPVEVTTNAVSIAGKVNNSVKILLSAPGDHNGTASLLNVYDGGAQGVNLEHVVISASIDDGPFQRLGQYSPTAGVNSLLFYDANGDGIGGESAPPAGVPASLNDTFQEATFPIGTGGNVRVKVSFFTNGSYEYILFDNIRIFAETAATLPPSIANVPATPLGFTEGGAPVAVAPGIVVEDNDSLSLPSATVSITQNHTPGEDVLTAQPSGSITAGDISFSSATGVLTIAGPSSPAEFTAVLASVQYQNTNVTNPATGTRHVTFATTDGTNPSNSPVRQITVTDLVPVQSLPFTESFETDGRGTRYGVLGGFISGNSLFARLNPDPNVDGTDGDHVFAVERTLADPAPLEAVTFHVNTAGYGNLKLDMLAATQGGSVFEQIDDFLFIQTSVDGGTWETKYAFRSTAGAGGVLALDTDLNGSGDGTALTSTLENFSFDLPDATTLGVRIVAATDGNGERILFDNLRVTGEQAEFSIADASAAENDETITFNVTRSGNTAGEAQVTYSLTAGTATSGTDYQATTGVLTFEDGVTSLPVTVTLVDDTTVELDETFTVVLSAPSTGVLTDDSATGTITNDDSSVISIAGSSVAEGDSGTANLTFTVSLSNPVDTAVTVDYQTQSTGTAVAGIDFTAASGTLTINAGATSASFNVTVNGDDEVESDETVNASISNPSVGGRLVTLGTSTATGTITNDDPELIAVDGNLAVKLGTSGKLKVANLLALTSPVEGREVSIVSVGPGTTAGGTVIIVDGWIYYQPPAGYTGLDTFTFTITDGVQTVTGTVTVTAAGEALAESVNIVGLLNEEDDKRVIALGIPGRRYRLQTSGDLENWATSGSSTICPPGGVMSFVDEGPLPPTRFYRVIEAPILPPP